jgi:uncharacterized protein
VQIIGVEEHASGGMSDTALYVALSTALGPAVPDRGLLDEHLAWMRELEASGRLFAAGPLFAEDGALQGDGVLVVRAEDAADAQAVLDADPFVVHGHRRSTARRWEIHQGSPQVAIRLSDGSSTLS